MLLVIEMLTARARSHGTRGVEVDNGQDYLITVVYGEACKGERMVVGVNSVVRSERLKPILHNPFSRLSVVTPSNPG